jgi:hypothetical protein
MDDYELVITETISKKLELKHDVTEIEVEEAFHNFYGVPLYDSREEHRTIPATIWFISETADGRLLKVIGIPFKDEKIFLVKSAFEPNHIEISIYEKNQ